MREYYARAGHIGDYQPDQVSVSDGYLRISLTQEYGTVDGVGGMIYSKLKCGYGTYEWNVRMSTTSKSPTDLSSGRVGGQTRYYYLDSAEFTPQP